VKVAMGGAPKTGKLTIEARAYSRRCAALQ
jgi:hypothetical protein